MTVCVGVSVNDCLVFAADSASSIVLTTTDENGVASSSIANVYQNGDKVYNLHKKLPIMAMTCGMGNIGSDSIGTLAKKLRRLLTSDADLRIDPENYTVEDVANKARSLIFDQKYSSMENKPTNSSLEFWVGGYSSHEDSGKEVWKISIVDGNCPPPEQVVADDDTGVFWGGQPGPINRLLMGFDPQAIHILRDLGVPAEAVNEIESNYRSRLGSSLVMATMPVRDAISLADYLVSLTKDFFRFLPGADIVGGETDIAVVTRYEGFKWIKRKHFYPSSLNPLETDHA